MAATLAPIKVDRDTDDLISHAAHFLSASKKDIVDLAVREYVDNHRTEINAGVRAALSQLDGTTSAAVSLLTGMTKSELDELGGFAE